MALQADPQIHVNKVIEIKNNLQNKSTTSTIVKEEITPIKTEKIDVLNGLTENTYEYDGIENNLIKEYVSGNNIEQLTLEKKCYNLTLEYKNEVCQSNCSKKNVELIKPKDTDNLANEESLCDISFKTNLSDVPLPNLFLLNKNSDVSLESTDFGGFCGETAKATETSKLLKQNNKFKQYYMKHYEKQVALLDNPDCQKIISMGMSKKEKDQAKVLCRECGKTVTFRYYVSVHVHTHIGNKPFICDICGRSFVREYILKQHMRVHVDIKQFSCDICGRPFRTLQGAEIHKKTHSDERSYPCNTCDKSFKYKETLRQHLLTHKEDKNFMCELCGNSFRNRTGLIRHKSTHNTERTFMCTMCGKGFKSQPLLNSHMKRHSDNKPYVCCYCRTRFKSNNVLQSHVLIHTGAKPFSCKICDKKFRQRPSLRYHMRIHTGETPYECSLCQSKFKYKQHLSNHMKIHKKEIL